MLRVLTFKKQNKVFQALIEIIKVLATVEGREADYAIGDVYRIASIVGGKEMTKALRGGTKIRMNNITLAKWSKDDMASHIKALEEIIERESYV